MIRGALALAAALVASIPGATAGQSLGHRGFVEFRGTWFAGAPRHDPRQAIGDVIARDDVFVDPTSWLRLATGIEARANSHAQVERSWRVRFDDRTTARPAIAIRRLSASLSVRGLAVDLGKQFIRWGKADVVTPTDRFAPRDYLAVIDSEFLAVRGARVSYAVGDNTVEAVLVPSFTPSRMPLLTQRWTVPPVGVTLVDMTPGEAWPRSAQTGVRVSHAGAAAEYSLAFFNGFNHLPNIELAGSSDAGSGAVPSSPLDPPMPIAIGVRRSYPHMRMYGGDLVVPTPWATIKGEAAYFTTGTQGTDEYVIYVVQLERQIREWLLIAGYAGSAVTKVGGTATFAPDRGITGSVVGRASYTIDSTRSAAFEAAVRETGKGVYVKGEVAQLSGSHWRTTLAGALIRGAREDFLGQFRDNGHLSVAVRYSF